MNPEQQNNLPYIMGGYEYYPEDSNVFAFDANAASSHNGPNLWFNEPFQAVYMNEAGQFVFDSNPPLVSNGDDAGEILVEKNYDNPTNISSWNSTAPPSGLEHRTNGINLDCGYVNADPAGQEYISEGQSAAAFLPHQALNSTSTSNFPLDGAVAAVHHSSPIYSSFGVASAFSTPHSRVISTSTTNSSCPGSSSTLVTPRFDPATHHAPLQYSYDQAPLRKPGMSNLLTPEMPDVFTAAPLVPPPINQAVRPTWPEALTFPGQSPAIAGYQQVAFTDAPQTPTSGRSLRSTPSIESLRGSSFEDESGPYKTQALMSPFGLSAYDSASMTRTHSAPGCFSNAHLPQQTPRRQTRQPSENWTSPFTTTPFVAGPTPNLEVKSVKRKPSSKTLFTAEPMTRSSTATEFATLTSPTWISTFGSLTQSAPATSAMVRSATMTEFQPGLSQENLDGWTSQVPLAICPRNSFQAVDAIDTTHTSAFTSIPAVRVGLNESKYINVPASLHKDRPQYSTVPKGVPSRQIKKLPKRNTSSGSSVQLTFMNFGPKDAKEITNAVAESGKSKRRRQEDSSSGEDTVEKTKRCKTQTSPTIV